MSELLALINALLVLVFEIIENFLAPYYFIILFMVVLSLFLWVMFYIAQMTRTHT